MKIKGTVCSIHRHAIINKPASVNTCQIQVWPGFKNQLQPVISSVSCSKTSNNYRQKVVGLQIESPSRCHRETYVGVVFPMFKSVHEHLVYCAFKPFTNPL